MKRFGAPWGPFRGYGTHWHQGTDYNPEDAPSESLNGRILARLSRSYCGARASEGFAFVVSVASAVAFAVAFAVVFAVVLGVAFVD